MCNINIVYNKKKNNLKVTSELMNVLSWASYQSNPHGEGYIRLNGKMSFEKSENKMIFNEHCYFLATHQRFATSGLKDDNNSHPHVGEGLYVLHNGVFSGKGDAQKSDTAVFTEDLAKEYKSNGYDLIKAIKDVIKITAGSFSIMIYEERTGKVYYFKDGGTKMSFIENEEWLVMSTDESNVNYASSFLDIKGEVKEFEVLKIYDVLEGVFVGEVEKNYAINYSYYGYGQTQLTKDYQSGYSFSPKKKKKKGGCIFCWEKGYGLVKCKSCGDHFHNYCSEPVLFKNKIYCDFCIKGGVIKVNCVKCGKSIVEGEYEKLFDYYVSCNTGVQLDLTEGECMECLFKGVAAY